MFGPSLCKHGLPPEPRFLWGQYPTEWVIVCPWFPKKYKAGMQVRCVEPVYGFTKEEACQNWNTQLEAVT